MTVEAAYAQFRETETGSLETGKWADLVVLDTDLMECAEEAIPTARFPPGYAVNASFQLKIPIDGF